MTTQMNHLAASSFEQMYLRLRNDDGMMTVMSRMQVAYGIHERKACENAETMIRLVAAHENTANMLSEDALEVLDAFLTDSAFMSGYDRKIMLHQLYFGLKTYQDEELIEKIKEGASARDLFHEYYTRCGEDSTITEAMLEAEVRKMMGNYRISSKAMRHIVKQMERNQTLRATAAELGEEGMRFKAIVAMDLYLRNQDTLTMEEAVQIACTNVEYQAMSDGLSQGLITEEQARQILAVIMLLCILAAIAMAFYAPYLNEGLEYLCTEFAAGRLPLLSPQRLAEAKIARDRAIVAKEVLAYSGFGIAIVSEKVAVWMGKVAAKRTFVRSAEEADTAAAMENMISRMEREAQEPSAARTEVKKEQIEVQKQAAQVYT